jgi:hypothetical protein
MVTMDCFVAEFIIGPAEGGTRWLLAMTVFDPTPLAMTVSTPQCLGYVQSSSSAKAGDPVFRSVSYGATTRVAFMLGWKRQ